VRYHVRAAVMRALLARAYARARLSWTMCPTYYGSEVLKRGWRRSPLQGKV